MSRPRKPWYRKSKKRWFVEINGKQVNLGPDKEEAFRQFHKLMSEPLPELKAPPTSQISLPEIADHFLSWVQRHRAEETYLWYQYRLERLCQLYPTMQAEQMRPFHIEDWVNRYDFSITSRRNYMRAAKRCFKWAKKQGYLESNPIEDLEVPSAEEREVLVELDEFEVLKSYTRNRSLLDLIVVTWETGCRPQELLKVEARHVDQKHQRWVFHKSESKGKRISRVVYMSNDAMAICRRLCLAHPSGPLFRNTSGKPWTTDAVNCGFTAVQMRMGKDEMTRQGIEISDAEIQAFIPTLNPTKREKGSERPKRAAELREEAKRKLTYKTAAQLATRYSLYALRHSFATHALRKGIDSLTVAVLLGHEDPSTLARVYQHLNQNPEHLLSQIRLVAG